jgi:tetratricopeptide (TPR) repeat protein
VAVLPHDDRIYVPTEAIDVEGFREGAVEISQKAESFPGGWFPAHRTGDGPGGRRSFPGVARKGGRHAPALRDLSVSLERLGDVELDAGNLMAATAAYRECLELDRRQRMRQGDTPQVLRDLSQSSKLGDVEREAGQLSVATEAYRESLEPAGNCGNCGRLGDTPQVLRDLSVSLEAWRCRA